MSNPSWQDVALHRAAEIADLRTILDSERRTSRDALSELASMTALCDRIAGERDALRASLHALATGLRWEEELRAWVLTDLGALTRARQALEVGR